MSSLKKFIAVALAVLGLTAASISPSVAAAYVKYDGINGEALTTTSDPASGIDLGDSTPRLAQLVRSGEGAGTITFSRARDGASPLLARWAQEGRRFRTLDVYVPNRRGEGYLHYQLTNVRVSNYSISTDTGRQSAEEVAVLFQYAVYEGRED